MKVQNIVGLRNAVFLQLQPKYLTQPGALRFFAIKKLNNEHLIDKEFAARELKEWEKRMTPA